LGGIKIGGNNGKGWNTFLNVHSIPSHTTNPNTTLARNGDRCFTNEV